jgi:hypothetical protein
VTGLQAVTEKPGLRAVAQSRRWQSERYLEQSIAFPPLAQGSAQVVAPWGRRHLRDMSRHGLLEVWADCLLGRATDVSAMVRGPRWAFTADAHGRAGTPK